MKRILLHTLYLCLVVLAGMTLFSCAPMVYDSNPRFSNHRVPPAYDPYYNPAPPRPGAYYNPAPARPATYNPVPVKPGTYPGQKPTSPAPGNVRPGNQTSGQHNPSMLPGNNTKPAQAPTTPAQTTTRPGSNNR